VPAIKCTLPEASNGPAKNLFFSGKKAVVRKAGRKAPRQVGRGVGSETLAALLMTIYLILVL
jgi:hypothetical protein